MENKTVRPAVSEKDVATNVLNCFRRLRLSALYLKRIKHKDVSVLSELNRVDPKVLGMWFKALPTDALGDLMAMILDPASINYSRQYASVSRFNGRIKYNIEDKESGLFSRPQTTPMEEEINKLELRLKNLKQLQAMSRAPAPKSIIEELASKFETQLEQVNAPVVAKGETVELGVNAMEDLKQAMASIFDSIPPVPKAEVAIMAPEPVMTEVLEVMEEAEKHLATLEKAASKPVKKKKTPKKATPKKKPKKAPKKAISRSRKRRV